MIKKDFIQLVESENVEKIQRKLLVIFSTNPSLKNGEFQESLEYADKYIGEKLYSFSSNFQKTTNRSEWTDDYVAKIIGELNENFTKDIVLHLMEVAPCVYKNSGAQLDQQKQTRENKGYQKKQSQKTEDKNPLTTRVCLVGAIILLIIFLCLILGEKSNVQIFLILTELLKML